MAETLTVRDMVQNWLQEHGYDGLLDPDGLCGCSMDNLLGCEGYGTDIATCTPGYSGPDPDDDGEYLIYPTKEARDAAVKKAKENSDESS